MPLWRCFLGAKSIGLICDASKASHTDFPTYGKHAIASALCSLARAQEMGIKGTEVQVSIDLQVYSVPLPSPYKQQHPQHSSLITRHSAVVYVSVNLRASSIQSAWTLEQGKLRHISPEWLSYFSDDRQQGHFTRAARRGVLVRVWRECIL